jgi:hypothetical protein
MNLGKIGVWASDIIIFPRRSEKPTRVEATSAVNSEKRGPNTPAG